MNDALIASLTRAVEATPDDVPLRLHLAELMLAADRREDAVGHLATVLNADPENQRARALLSEAFAAAAPAGFDWSRAEADLAGPQPPAVASVAFDVDLPAVTLADVGGLADVKARLAAGFLTPLRNPGLRRLYGKSLRGGLMLYGPPGCGKTFLARAVAGELDAGFIPVSLADVLDMWVGQSERNLHEVFELARRSAPCVLFLDEVDAIGQKRTQLRSSAMRSTVNQLLAELDGIASDNDGVFVLAATNAPWDVDVALRRPGRLDRALLVLPPDDDAREAILRYHLRGRPIAAIDISKVAARTGGMTGADLAHVCETAAERALMDSAVSGVVRMIEMRDLNAALAEVRPSARAWFDTARNVALFANDSGEWDELLRYLKQHRMA
jgi:SpoVK/Ycf46/Vps4 family AAA+-type ATPase